MADNVLDSYLIALGFKVDAASKQRFTDTVDSAMKAAIGLAAAWTATATAVAATVTKIASSLDEMYFSAQRANTSVANVKAYTYALSQLGVSASAAGSTIEGIARAIRTNPGNESLLHALGVQTRDANGGLRDTVDIMVDLDKQLSKKPQYIGTQYAAALGLDESTFNALRGKWGELQKQMADYRQKAAAMGVDPDKAAAEANQFMSSVRDFQAQIDLLVQKMVIELGPTIEGYLKQFGDWIRDHRAEIIEFLDGMVKSLVEAAKGLGELAKEADPVLQKFLGMADALTGENGLKEGLKDVLKFMATIWVAGMIAQAAKVSAAFGWLGPVLALIGGSAYVANQIAPGYEFRTDPATGMQYAVPKGYKEPEGGATMGGAIRRGFNWFKEKVGLGGSSNTPNVTSAQKKAYVRESFDFWLSKGFTREQAAGIVANEMHETGMRPNAVGDHGTAFGIGQWRGNRVSNIKAGTGIDVTSADHKQQLEAMWWEMNNGEHAAQVAVRNAETPSQAAARFSTLFERPLATFKEERMRAVTAEKILRDIDAGLYAPAAAAQPVPAATIAAPAAPDTPQQQWARKKDGILHRNNMLSPDLTGASTPLLPLGMPLPGVHSPSFSQTNSIVVHGASDPKATADEIERRQRGLNGELLGNVKGVVQ